MELNNMKKKETKRVEVYYERIQKLAHGLQVQTTNKFLTTIFRTSLQSYDYGDEVVKLQHKEVAIFCEKGMTIA